MRYVNIRIPEETYNLLKLKQQKIAIQLMSLSNSNKVKVPMIKVVKAISMTPVYINDTELLNMFGVKQKRWIKKVN